MAHFGYGLEDELDYYESGDPLMPGAHMQLQEYDSTPVGAPTFARGKAPGPTSDYGQGRGPPETSMPDPSPPTDQGKHHRYKPRQMTGQLMWAKTSRLPWWPAQVLTENDPSIPPGMSEPPRRGAVPVRFFGTYDFVWIESQRALTPFEVEFEEKSTNTRQPAFSQAMAEALHFQKTGELPGGFLATSLPSPGPKRGGRTPRGRGRDGDSGRKASGEGRGRGRGSRGGRHGGGPQAYPVEVAAEHRQRVIRDRQLAILRGMGLVPPAGSPYATSLCVHPKMLEQFPGLGSARYPPS